MGRLTESDERRVEAFLAPLAGVAPVRLPARKPARRRRGAVIAVCALLATGGAAVAGTEFFDPSDTVVTPRANKLTCAGLLGGPAEDAAQYFEARGYRVSWRYLTFGGQVYSVPGSGVTVVGGGKSIVLDQPRPGTIVRDFAGPNRRDPHTVIVFISDPDAKNAPHLVPPTDCPVERGSAGASSASSSSGP